MSTWGTTTAAPAARAGTVDVLVGLLAELDEATESGVFYDRVCQAVVTLTSMRRAVLLLHDETYRSVIPVGASGVSPELMKRIGGTIDETPIAQIALEEVRVVEVNVNGVDGDLAEHVPARYAELPESSYLSCTPISAARRWLGVIFADRAHPLDVAQRRRADVLRIRAQVEQVQALEAQAQVGFAVLEPRQRGGRDHLDVQVELGRLA